MLHDRDIREPLFEFLEETYGKIRIIEEKTMGRSRADVIMVLETGLYGIEIKSDADTYVRLASQVKDYEQYFDRNIIVVGATHAMGVQSHVPDHWGIITVEEVDGKADFYILRWAKDNPQVQWEKKLQMLWKPELAAILQEYNLPKYKEKSRRFVIEKICANMPGKIPEDGLARLVSEILFERDYTKADETLREYRKGEIQKQLEQETDPGRLIELYMLRAEKNGQMAAAGLRKKRRGRKRRKE